MPKDALKAVVDGAFEWAEKNLGGGHPLAAASLQWFQRAVDANFDGLYSFLSSKLGW
jgi:hypothetical protein